MRNEPSESGFVQRNQLSPIEEEMQRMEELLDLQRFLSEGKRWTWR